MYANLYTTKDEIAAAIPCPQSTYRAAESLCKPVPQWHLVILDGKRERRLRLDEAIAFVARIAPDLATADFEARAVASASHISPKDQL